MLRTAYNSKTSKAILFNSYFTFSQTSFACSAPRPTPTAAPVVTKVTKGSITSVQQVSEAPASIAATQQAPPCQGCC